MRVIRPLLFLALVVACGAGAFDAQSVVTSVRVFGVRADKPYVKPGETVNLELLSADGRRDKTRPLRNFWVPIVCTNPRDDLYYACFIQGQATVQAPFPLPAGTPPAGGLDSIPVGVDLSAFLPQGPTFSFRMPDDVIVERAGLPAYGLAIVFNIACAGQVRVIERTPGGPQQVPIRCTDENGVALGADDFVLGISRVYAYADRVNANPVVDRVTLDGVPVDPVQGIVVDRCVAERRADCRAWKIDVAVPDSSWEENPSTANSGEQREQIWAAYFSDLGSFKDEARLLFDVKAGRVSESAVEFRAPYDPGTGTIWAVVHDNRAGAAFITLPLHVR